MNCVNCGKDTNGFFMRSISAICRDCIIEGSSVEEVDGYLTEVTKYIEEKGVGFITTKVLGLIRGDEMEDSLILLNNDLFKDAVHIIHGERFHMLEEKDLVIFIRNKNIEDILK
jgi:hypothetical protein